MILVSACLAGVNCKYNGGSSHHREIELLVAQGKAIPVCPEQLGGCGTPRPKAEIASGTGADVLDGKGRVIRETGEDATGEFVKGAYEVLKLAQLVQARQAILKSRSPSCGVGRIYDGSFSGKLIDGNGVTSELLLRNGLEVRTEEK